MADSTDEDSQECRVCGDTVASSANHRVVTAVEDGETVYEHFCSDDCLEIWES
ncbi:MULTISPECIES: DUF7576 family protein [Haloterrigena]|uniref:DUF7576 family protein n=1 Tax=Haloterrigena TaxID=121871 RepID=UPI000AD437C9|nr:MULTISPECIES: hypothetical protein [Haloterrigena]